MIYAAVRPVVIPATYSPTSPFSSQPVFSFNGTTQYAAHAGWTPSGNPAAYPPTIVYTTDNDDGYVVDDSAFPITEFGRVGANYHTGTLKNLQYIDTSPISSGSYFQAAAGRQIDFPAINLTSAVITFDMIYSTGDQVLCGGSLVILRVISDVLTAGVNTTYIEIDGTEYAGATLTDGQHYRVSCNVSGGSFQYLSGISGLGKLTIVNQE